MYRFAALASQYKLYVVGYCATNRVPGEPGFRRMPIIRARATKINAEFYVELNGVKCGVAEFYAE